MLDWLRNLLGPTPALAGACPGRLTLPAVMAFSEQGGGGEAPAPPPAPPAPAAETVTTPSGIMGRPLMTFVADMAAAAGSILLVLAWFFAIRFSLAWQGFFFGLGVLALVAVATLVKKKKNWAIVYAGLGAYQLVFLVLQWILGLGLLAYAILSLIGAILLVAAGVAGWFVFKTPELEKPWPSGVTFKCPGA